MALGTGVSIPAAENEYGPFRLGPLHLRPKVVLARYSGLGTSASAAPGDPSPDSSTALTPSLEGTIPVGRRLRFNGGASTSLNLSGSKQGAFYKGFGVFGGSAIDLGPISLFGSIGGGRGEERVSFEVDQRAKRHEKLLSAGAALRLGARITTSAMWSDRKSNYESDVLVEGASLDSTLGRESVTNHYQLQCAVTRLTSLTFSTDIVDDRFLADDKRVRSYRYLGGLEFSPLAFIRGHVQVGHRALPEGQGVPGYSGPTYLVGATMPLLGLGTLTANASRDITYSARRTLDGGRSTYVLNRYGGELRFGLPLSLVATGFYGVESALFPNRVQDLTAQLNRLHRYGGSLLRAFGRSLRVGGTVEAVEQNGLGTARQVSYFATAEWTP
jgi:hypothetical protein